MNMHDEQTVDILNKLVEINNDRIEGYETASKETDEQDLKTLFDELGSTSHQCRQELVREIESYDGVATDETRNSGKFFRVWMDVKAALTGKDRKTILNSCEFGESHAVTAYQEVLQDDMEHISNDLRSLIRNQYAIIKEDHERIKILAESAK
jgi:uncharacterized protein (TIGR02284 family)